MGVGADDDGLVEPVLRRVSQRYRAPPPEQLGPGFS